MITYDKLPANLYMEYTTQAFESRNAIFNFFKSIH
jgi:hypothetical protein